VVTNEIARRHALLFVLKANVLGFHSIRYKEHPEFKGILKDSPSKNNPYTIHEGYLFKGNELCIPRSSLRGILVQEGLRGALASQFTHNKTIASLRRISIGLIWEKMCSR